MVQILTIGSCNASALAYLSSFSSIVMSGHRKQLLRGEGGLLLALEERGRHMPRFNPPIATDFFPH